MMMCSMASSYLESNVTHQGKSDCRRDLWANKLHKHNQIVSNSAAVEWVT